ncbi:MAG: hypothetical protein WC508_01960 [Patescibacteria group bacterium]
MTQNHYQLPNQAINQQIPAGLFDKVILRLEQEKKLARAKKRLIIFSIVLLVSVAVSFPIGKLLQNEIIQSGFGQYISLLFYDFKTMLTYWPDFSLTLLETLPAIGLAGILTVMLAIIISLKSVITDGKTFLKLSHTHF